MGVETVLHSATQATCLDTHYIANNGFLFNFPSAGVIDMSYLTLKCVFTAGGCSLAEHVTSRCQISGSIPSIGKKIKKLKNNNNKIIPNHQVEDILETNFFKTKAVRYYQRDCFEFAYLPNC